MRAPLVFVSAGLAASLLAATGMAVAGLKLDVPATININGSYAYGALGSARNSSGTYQAIGCSVDGWVYNGTGYSAVSCFAQDSSGNYASCYTSNSDTMARAVTGMTSDSYVYFQWDATGSCTYISSENNSYWAPKQP
jgi:hypothetical protein